MIHVAITGLNSINTLAPGLGVVQCLREEPLFQGKIIGLAYEALDAGIYAPGIVDAAYLLPYPSCPQAVYLERLLEIHAREKIDVIIPCLDLELSRFIQIKAILEQHGIQLCLPDQKSLSAIIKARLANTLEKFHINTPKTQVIYRLNEIGRNKTYRFPLYVKGHTYDSYQASNLSELTKYSGWLFKRWGSPIIVQERVEGYALNSVVLHNPVSQETTIANMRKLLLTENGKGWACVTVHNPELTRLSQQLANALAWPGPLEIETIHSNEDGKLYVTEVNPRFPGWVSLIKAAGINLPYLFLQMILGHSNHLP